MSRHAQRTCKGQRPWSALIFHCVLNLIQEESSKKDNNVRLHHPYCLPHMRYSRRWCSFTTAAASARFCIRRVAFVFFSSGSFPIASTSGSPISQRKTIKSSHGSHDHARGHLNSGRGSRSLGDRSHRVGTERESDSPGGKFAVGPSLADDCNLAAGHSSAPWSIAEPT